MQHAQHPPRDPIPPAPADAVKWYFRLVWSYINGAEGRSVTGGVVYRGKKFADLVGKYFCGDYISGKIWVLTYDGKTVTKNEVITNVGAVSAFGQDANGEIYILNYSSGKIYTLAKK